MQRLRVLCTRQLEGLADVLDEKDFRLKALGSDAVR